MIYKDMTWLDRWKQQALVNDWESGTRNESDGSKGLSQDSEHSDTETVKDMFRKCLVLWL